MPPRTGGELFIVDNGDSEWKGLRYQGALTPLEQMHLEFQKLLADTPGLQQRLDGLPGRVFSGKEHNQPGTKALFFCYALPAEDKSTVSLAPGGGEDRGEGARLTAMPVGSPAPAPDAALWSTDAGRAGWYLYDLVTGRILEQPEDIIACIRSVPETPPARHSAAGRPA